MIIDLKIANELKRKGFANAEIYEAFRKLEATGTAGIGGYAIRPTADNDHLILLHPSWGGIYVGDYTAKIIFQKNLSYSFGRFGFMSAKHGDLPEVLKKLDEAKTNGFILCECDAGSYNRRKKQVEKLGYTVQKSNIDHCKRDHETCVFLIA